MAAVTSCENTLFCDHLGASKVILICCYHGDAIHFHTNGPMMCVFEITTQYERELIIF